VNERLASERRVSADLLGEGLVSAAAAPTPTPLLRVRQVSWHAGGHAGENAGGVSVLERVAFEVAAGEFVAIMGRNGAGKSTLLDIVAGVRAPTEGAVVLGDRPLDNWTPLERARVIAHLPQTLRADLSMRADALVLMGRYAHASRWFESDEDQRIADEAMRRCECFEFCHRTLATLSSGERQRVFLAACLAQRAPLLLLDEPATYLDVDQQLHCFSVLRDNVDRDGMTCLAVTHDINLALTFCTRLLILADRGIARDMTTDVALDNAEWLDVFSPRLHVERGNSDGATPWVRYR
jgi:ABC-type cobalamin/Fe3+-siderophores transport system ATPase subunit